MAAGVNHLPYWHPDADYSGCRFFIRRMNTRGFTKPPQIPVSSLPMIGFIFLTEGEILVESDGRTYLCSAGHLLLIPERMPFAILHFSDAVGFTGGFSSSDFQASRKLSVLLEPHQQAFWFDEGSFLGELFNMMASHFDRGDEAFTDKGLELLITMLRHGPTVRLPDLVSSFLDDVFNDDPQKVSLSYLSEKAGVSANYLNRIVKGATRHSVGAWIDTARISAAKKLLRETDLPIIDVAAAVGLEDQSYFSRFFRKHVGVTPTDYRRSMHG